MVNYDPNYRLRRIFDVVVPSIINTLEDKDFQLNMLEKHRGIAHLLNEKCETQIGDINQYFDDYKELILNQHKEGGS